jgi:hypothetical protein
LEELKEIVSQFESIGDNCEFGLYQRHVEVEPINLFRFSSAALPHLLNVLTTRFSGVGDPANVHLHAPPSNSWEYMAELRDQPGNYSFIYHTGVH